MSLTTSSPNTHPKTSGSSAAPEPSAPTRVNCINTSPVYNRIFGVMMHTTRYAFKAQARLARDCGVSPSTICRLLTGQSSPSFALVAAITGALEKQLKKQIDPRELISPDGTFRTALASVFGR
jgi:DNA-binding XRE family transcriptional regulator